MDTSNVLTKEQITNRVLRVIEKFSEIKPLKTSDSISSIGFDSLDRVEILLFLEDEFNIALFDGDEMAGRFKTLGDIVDYVAKEMKCGE